MNELINPVAANCLQCGNPTKPKIIQRKEPNGSILQEAKYICSRCGSLFKQGIVRKPTDPYSVK